MLRQIVVYVLACQSIAAVKLTQPQAPPPGSITHYHLLDIWHMLGEDGILIDGLPEVPFVRIGFHIAATRDSTLGRGGWNEFPTRAELVSAGLLDDVIAAYYDPIEEYYTFNRKRMYGMSKPDYISFLIYVYCLQGTYSSNITWRAGRRDSSVTSDHMLSGRPDMPEGFSTQYKPEPNMSSAEYMRVFFSRIGFHEDADIVTLMLGHSLGTAHGYPYLGSWTYGYYEDMLNQEWVLGCPSTCNLCLWDYSENMDPARKMFYKKIDPYNTSKGVAPSNYTNPKMWGESCTQALDDLDHLFEYTTSDGDNFRLPVDMAMIQDDKFVTIISAFETWEEEQAAFGESYSKMLEVGVPEEDLYVVDLSGLYFSS